MRCAVVFTAATLYVFATFHSSYGSGGGSSNVIHSGDSVNNREFSQFCELGFMIRDKPQEVEGNTECAVTEPGEFSVTEDLPILFTLIMMCTWGAVVRAVAKEFQIKTPYTVLLLISGAAVGACSHSAAMCETVHKYTAIARISPQHILYTFLPVLIFESAFSISVHTFTRSFAQIFILAFPGMLLSCFLTAIICQQFFTLYEWDFLTACLFGCIVSATDPVAVVAILRDLGVSEQLGVIIDGESLMNDGVAILLFEIFHHYLVHSSGSESGVIDIIIHVTLKFFQISLGGPVWGWICARITIFWLGYVYNDAAVEIATTMCAAYLTYWASEAVLGVSGVIAVVVLGVTMSAERTVISPESEGPVHHFWEMLGYLANTVLFVLVGIVISETAIVHFDWIDIPYLILLYISLHVVRFLMLLTFYPALKRLGYGLEWQNLMVIMWGGLRGAVGICLALQIYEDESLCSKDKVGPKFLFHTAGIVLMTLVINGTTTKGLLKTLKLTDVTVGQKEEMNNAVRRIRRTKWSLIRAMQMSKLMLDADWKIVNNICEVDNPYAASDDGGKKTDSTALQPPRPVKDNTTVCWHCSNIVENEPTIIDYREMTNDARLRAIKSMKIHYLHMFEKGTLTEQATQLLLVDAEYAEDKYLHVIHAQNFHKYMKAHGFYLWLRDKVIVRFNLHKEESLPEPPDAEWRHTFYRIVNKEWFEALCFIVIVFNIISVIWDVVLIYASTYSNDQCLWTSTEEITKKGFYYSNYAFCTFYTVELIIRLLGTRLNIYFCSTWNYLDMVVLIVAYVDLYLGKMTNDRNIVECKEKNLNKNYVKEYFSLFRGLRLLQFTRILRLLRPLVPQVLRKIKRQLNLQVFIGYDMGKGFVETSDAVIKFIPQIVENKKVQQVIKQGMRRERNACVKDLALIHSKYPGVAIALKTRHACRASLNQMQFALTEIRDGGLLDDSEYKLLKRILEEKMKRLTHSPCYIAPTKPLSSDHGFHDQDEDKKSNLSGQPSEEKMAAV